MMGSNYSIAWLPRVTAEGAVQARDMFGLISTIGITGSITVRL